MGRPRPGGTGDLASDVALHAGPTLALDVARALAADLRGCPGIAAAEVSGPGYLNVLLTGRARAGVAAGIVAAGPAYAVGSMSAGALGPRATRERDDADLVEAVGLDVYRYAVARDPGRLRPSLDRALLPLARRVRESPLFRVQYAHARATGLLINADDVAVTAAEDGSLESPQEAALVALLAELPRVVRLAATRGESHRVARHLEEVADAFYGVLDTSRVLPRGDEPVTRGHRSRRVLVDASRVVLANGLGILGVTAPPRW